MKLLSLIAMMAVVAVLSAADDNPSADQILDKYVRAIGGKAALEKQTSRVSKGTLELPTFNASGTIETYSKAPNKTLLVVNVAGFGELKRGFNGTVGWELHPQNGLRESKGVELAIRKRDAEFHRPLKLKDQYSKLTVAGKAKVGDRDAYIVEATPAEGKPEKLYFDTENGLLVRWDVEVPSPEGTLAIQHHFSDYRDVDGVKLPFTIRQVRTDFELITKLNEIMHGVAVGDSKFDKPAN